jgi:hypothetical protein
MVYSFRKDNEGPPNATEVLSDFADARSWFPGAEVLAGTLDEFVGEALTAAQVRQRGFGQNAFNLQMIMLPRQARDKHKGTLKKEPFSCSVPACR